MRVAAVLIALAWMTACHAEVYVSVDADGVLCLTDRPPASVPLRQQALETQARAAAARHGVDARLVQAIIRVESNYDPRAVSPKGAAGLMQLMPQTAKRYGVSDRFDPAQNLDAGVRYLRDLLALFSGDLRLALAAYNAGENAVIRHRGVPAYGETRQYVSRVTALYLRGL